MGQSSKENPLKPIIIGNSWSFGIIILYLMFLWITKIENPNPLLMLFFAYLVGSFFFLIYSIKAIKIFIKNSNKIEDQETKKWGKGIFYMGIIIGVLSIIVFVGMGVYLQDCSECGYAFLLPIGVFVFMACPVTLIGSFVWVAAKTEWDVSTKIYATIICPILLHILLWKFYMSIF